MAWDRTNNLWVRKQKRRYALSVATSGVMLVVLVVLVVMATMMWRIDRQFARAASPAAGGGLDLWLLFPLCLNLLPLAFVLHVCRRERRILRAVPDHDAMICPKCLSVMESEDEQHVACPRGHSFWPRDELLHYWEQFGLARLTSWHALRTSRRKYESKGSDWWGGYHEWVRTHPTSALAFVPVISTLVLMPLMALTVSRSPMDTIRFGLFVYLFATGGICLGVGMKQRRGSDEHCAACNYRRVRVDAHAAKRCPECGAAWNAPGGVVRGIESSRPGFVVAGVLLSLLGFVLGPSSPLGLIPRYFANAMPTSALITSAGTLEHSGSEVWTEIGSRPLTDSERNRLASLLLDQRLEISYFSATDGSAWLESQISAAALPAELIERFFKEALSLRLDGPESARVGEEFTVAVEGASRLGGNSLWRAEAAVAGFRSDDHDAVHGREGKWRMGFEFDTEMRGYVMRERLVGIPQNDRVSPVAILKWDKPGRHTIHFTAFIVIRPSASGYGYTLDWNPDHTPVLPGDEACVIPVDLTHTIEVIE